MHFLNLGHAVETANRLAGVVLDGEDDQAGTVRGRYRQAVSRLRPIPVAGGAGGGGVSIGFEDGPWGEYLLANHVFEDIFVGVGESYPVRRQAWARTSVDAIAYVSEVDADLGWLVELLVTDVVLLSSERTGGGSASTLPGLVCMSPGEGWSMFDFAESLVHETTHLNLFVADMMYGLYELPSSVLAASEYRVLSAVKIGELRPLDKAFHTAAVAVPLMYMQHVRGESTLVDLYGVSLREACRGLQAKRQYFTEYGRMLVDELTVFADGLDFAQVKEAIGSGEYAGYVPALSASA